MAQIWLTYEEMAEAFGGSARQAREAAIENGWARMKGRDGVAHVRLTPAMARDYLLRQLLLLQRHDREALTDAMVASLRSVLPASSSPRVPNRLPAPRAEAA